MPRIASIVLALLALCGSAAADLPPSPLVKLVSPINGAVVYNTPGGSVTLRFEVDWPAIKQKYAGKQLFSAIGLYPQGYSGGIMLGDTIVEGQTTKTFTFAQIDAEMKKAGLPTNSRYFWNVMVRPKNTASPETTDRTEGTFGLAAPVRQRASGGAGTGLVPIRQP